MNVTLRQMQYFCALCDTQHFGRAAEKVHVSQPALSVQIKEIEQTLGAQLVERRARAVVITALGREVEARCREILKLTREMTDLVRHDGGLSGRLNLGVIPTVAPYLLPVALPLLRARDISLDLRVREAQTRVLIEELEEGHLDAVVIASHPGRVDMVSELLFDDRFLLAGSSQLLTALAADNSLRPDRVDPDHLLLLDEGHCLADQALEVCGLSRQGVVDLGASSLATLAGLAAQGFGLTFLPEIAVKAETSANTLAVRRFAGSEPLRRITLVRRGTSRAGVWFDDLAAILRQAGDELLSAARPG